jgi:signal peptidase II
VSGPRPMALTARLREIVDSLQSARSRLLEAVAGVDQAGMDSSPGAGRWSIGEILHHLQLIERSVTRVLARQLERAQSSGDGPDPRTDSVLGSLDDKEVERSPERIASPPGFIPGRALSRGQLLDGLADSRRALLLEVRRAAAVALLIILAAAGWDQGSKSLARARLEGRPAISVVDRVVLLQWVENEGAFLSLGAGFPRAVRMIMFIAFPLVVLGFMLGFLLRPRGAGWGTLTGLSLIVGGGAGNLIDRIFRDGRVGDFILLAVGGLHTGIFNFADLAVMAGCVVLLFAPSSGGRRPPEQGPGA